MRWFLMENPIKMDDLGGKPTIFGNTHIANNNYNSRDRSLQAVSQEPGWEMDIILNEAEMIEPQKWL